MDTFFPATLETFVEPIFPLPSNLTSLPVAFFTIKYPKGIAPEKNAITKKK